MGIFPNPVPRAMPHSRSAILWVPPGRHARCQRDARDHTEKDRLWLIEESPGAQDCIALECQKAVR